MSCDYQSILAAARCFECIPPGAQSGIQTKLLQEISGASGSVDQMMAAARCIATCIPGGILDEVKTNLLCEVVDNLSGNIVVPSPDCADADAQAFFAAAAISDQTQRNAICRLVSDLKSFPAVGTKYWDRELAIYPFVGGTAPQHSVNLKTPGTYNILWLGTQVHSALGVRNGGGAGDYGRSFIQIPSQNSFRASWYLDLDTTLANTFYYGAADAFIFGAFFDLGTTKFRYRCNDGSSDFTVNVPPISGLRINQRHNATNKEATYGVQGWDSVVFASGAQPTRYINLFAGNSGGVSPIGSPSNPMNGRISSFSFGSPLDTSSNAEHLEYKGIWDTFHTTLGRGHP